MNEALIAKISALKPDIMDIDYFLQSYGSLDYSEWDHLSQNKLFLNLLMRLIKYDLMDNYIIKLMVEFYFISFAINTIAIIKTNDDLIHLGFNKIKHLIPNFLIYSENGRYKITINSYFTGSSATSLEIKDVFRFYSAKYFLLIKRVKDEQEFKLLHSIWKLKNDMVNLILYYRTRFIHNREFYYKKLILPSYITQKDITIIQNENSFLQLLEKKYSVVIKKLDALDLQKILYAMYKYHLNSMFYHSFDVAKLVSFLELKQIEIMHKKSFREAKFIGIAKEKLIDWYKYEI